MEGGREGGRERERDIERERDRGKEQSLINLCTCIIHTDMYQCTCATSNNAHTPIWSSVYLQSKLGEQCRR